MKRRDLEFRQLGEGRKPEIVCWKVGANDEWFCYTLCWWDRDKEGYNLEFIGSRPFEYDDIGTLWPLLEYADKVLQAQFELEKKNES